MSENATDALIQEVQWQLESFDKLSHSLSNELLERVENQQQRIRELEEVLQEAIYANPFSRPGWINRAKTLLEQQR